MRKPARPPDLSKVVGDDLFSKFSEQAYQTFMRRCEDHYWHWDKLRFAARGAGLDPPLVWGMVKLGRMQRYRHLPLTGHSGIPVRYNLPDRAQRELMLIDQELAGRIAFDEERPLTDSQRERFIISALREEAIASSMLEGAATTRRDAKNMLRTGRRPRTHGERMVLNNYRAIMFIREHHDVGLSPDFLLELQETLTEETLKEPSEVGRFRTENDDIRVVDDRDNEVMHIPPPASELENRLAALCQFANKQTDDEPFIHPVVKACILHFQLGFDHPFCDGNGRTARALFYWSMLRDGYWLFEYLPISRLIYRSPGSYARSYLQSETDDFDATYFLLYHLRVISLARHELQSYLSRKLSQVRKARRLFSDDLSLNDRQRTILLQTTRNPDRTFTIEKHQRVHAVAYDTARHDLLGLVRKGYLTKVLIGNRYEFLAGPKFEGSERPRRRRPRLRIDSS